MARLFGFSIGDKEKKSASIVSPVPSNNEDGVDNFVASSFYGSYVDIEGCLLYTSPSPRDKRQSRMPSSA